MNCSFQDNLSVHTESNNTFIMVWALPKSLFSRFNYHQQKYMYNLFIEGETIGKKAPKKVALEMKNLRTDGEKYFSSKEYLHATQIKSLFSSYVKLKKDGKLTPPTNKTVSIDDEIQNDNHDYDAIMEQQLSTDIVSNINSDMIVKLILMIGFL